AARTRRASQPVDTRDGQKTKGFAMSSIQTLRSSRAVTTSGGCSSQAAGASMSPSAVLSAPPTCRWCPRMRRRNASRAPGPEQRRGEYAGTRRPPELRSQAVGECNAGNSCKRGRNAPAPDVVAGDHHSGRDAELAERWMLEIGIRHPGKIAASRRDVEEALVE